MNDTDFKKVVSESVQNKTVLDVSYTLDPRFKNVLAEIEKENEVHVEDHEKPFTPRSEDNEEDEPATEPPQEFIEPEAKFGDFNGVCLHITTSNGPTTVDRNGIDIFTGVKYELPKEYIQKITEAEAEGKTKQFSQARFDFQSVKALRTWDYDGLIARGVYCLWLGARKAEKSLFALRKAMHDACGKNWLNHKNLVGPVRVLYFDSENDKADVYERYGEIITEFLPAEQKLIQKNLVIFIGKELKREKVNIEFNNQELWEFLKLNSGNPQVVYLDCWYQLQSIKAADNEAQKKALEMFEDYFPNTTLFLLHHTGRESQESLLRKNPAWLRLIGAERWSSKSSGGNVLTKKAELIICQEKYVERDQEGVEGDSFIDFQAYSRSSPGSILYSFEPVFAEEIDGVIHEYKFRRKMVVKLSSLAAQAARKLRGKGPWPSKYALTKDIGMHGGKQYRAIDELIVKGFITQEQDDFYMTGDDEAIELSADNVIAVKTAGDLLDELLLRPDGRPNAGVEYNFIKARAEAEGISMASIQKARQRKSIESVERDNKTWWTAGQSTEKQRGRGRLKQTES